MKTWTRFALALPVLCLAACHDSLPSVSATKAAAKQLSCEGYPRTNGDSVTVCEARAISEVATQGAPRVASTNGDVQAVGNDSAAINGTAYVFGTGATEERAAAIAAGVTVVAADDDYRGEPPVDLAPNESWGVGFDLTLPAASNLSASSTNGLLTATGLQGQISLDATNGSIIAVGLAGTVAADAANGDVAFLLLGTSWGEGGVTATATNGSAGFFAPDDYNAQFSLKATNGQASSEFEGASCTEDTTSQQCEITLGEGGALLSAEATNGDAVLGRSQE